MDKLDVDCIFTNILLEETIETCTNELKEFETVEYFSESEFKELLSTTDSLFIFDGTLYKEIDGLTMAPL